MDGFLGWDTFFDSFCLLSRGTSIRGVLLHGFFNALLEDFMGWGFV
jgi:hypothetical protein